MPKPVRSVEAMLGLEPSEPSEVNMLGGADNEGGGYDVDARRFRKAIEAGDGQTFHSILKGIVLDCLEEERAGGYKGGAPPLEVDYDDDEE